MMIPWCAIRVAVCAMTAGFQAVHTDEPTRGPGQAARGEVDARSAGVIVVGPAGSLRPENYTIAEGRPLRATWRAGDLESPWPAARLKHAFVRGQGTQQNMDSVASADGQSAEFDIEGPGVFVVGVTVEDQQAAVSEADARRLQPADALKAGHLVRRVACSKAIVRRGGDPPHGRRSSVATSKCGQPAELRLMMDPTAGPIPRDLPVRVFAGGSARAGATVRAKVLDAAGAVAADRAVKADAEGIANITIDRHGIWVIESELVVPAADGSLTWYQATASFEAVAP